MTFLADRGPISASRAWSGVAKLGGVPMRHILNLVQPTADARYAVFYSLADAGDTDRYSDVHKIANMRHALTLLAYEINGVPVSVLHDAPLRLRCENDLGFKIVKWIAAIEFVGDFEVLALVRADIMKTINSMATGCRSERSGVEDR
jgi:sulfoxide reductase catalytic subunit YedY